MSVEWVLKQLGHYAWLGPVTAVALALRFGLASLQARMSKEAKELFAEWLLSRQAVHSIQRMTLSFFDFFDRIYGFKRVILGVLFPSVLRAAALSMIIFLMSCVAFPEILAPIFDAIAFYYDYFGIKNALVICGILGSIIVLNGIFDTFSVAESRHILTLGAHRNWNGFLIVFLDLFLSALISLCFFIAFVILAVIFPSRWTSFFIDPQSIIALHNASTLEFVPIAVREAIGMFTGIFVSPTEEWTITDRLRFIFVFTTFSTSIWVWFYILSSYFGKTLLIFSQARNFLLKYFDIKDNPLTYVSQVVMAFVVVVGLPISYVVHLGVFPDSGTPLGGDGSNPTSPRTTPGTYIVLFDWDSPILTPEALDFVDAAKNSFIENCSSGAIAIAGHTDRSGPTDYNLRLSARRADSVRAYLQHRGIDITKLSLFPLGEAKPLVPTKDGEREPQNRRAEIVFDCPAIAPPVSGSIRDSGD